MIRSASPDTWHQFKGRLPKGRDLESVHLPADLASLGSIRTVVDYVPPDNILRALREWMAMRNETETLYFLTEGGAGEAGDFVVSLSSLNHDDLMAINPGRENAFASLNGDWAIFIDHEGALHVAGPSDLFDALNKPSQ